MTQRLIYVIGPSGAGRDSVLHRLREAWIGMPPAHWARRTITRAAQAGGETNECVDRPAFERLQQAGAFAMHWQANGHAYGIRRPELAPLASGHCVFVNGSRGHLPQLLGHWPEATVVQITAPADVLLQRLRARNRESVQAISDRLARGIEVELPASAIRIVNDGPLTEAVDMLFAALRVRFGDRAACAR
ncbi:phosphonate metabolism protein/1,5-bisphosphokinase (PRPP-forming) PhnN [Hydrogenophaga flava]|uniref:phosphonate metabolism protein/1,5-bisphosphokinase (PRPP-forming) PhnN n=1 Tax=Hydrogenophaga flava TaxID=65657 RepID=UPI000826CE5E|nr:phosphonate metabolism protein/1,5-bisphosphokinase (PRPP-forming) PhnN [Hydrogenophaga flava]